MELIFLDSMSTERKAFYDLSKYYPVTIRRIENNGWFTVYGIRDLDKLRRWLKEHVKEEVIVDTGWITVLHFYDEGDAVMFKMSEWVDEMNELEHRKF